MNSNTILSWPHLHYHARARLVCLMQAKSLWVIDRIVKLVGLYHSVALLRSWHVLVLVTYLWRQLNIDGSIVSLHSLRCWCIHLVRHVQDLCWEYTLAVHALLLLHLHLLNDTSLT